jgi:HEAT repeat protein
MDHARSRRAGLAILIAVWMIPGQGGVEVPRAAASPPSPVCVQDGEAEKLAKDLTSPDPKVRASAARTLAILMRESPKGREVLPLLIALAYDPSEEVREVVVEGLRSFADDSRVQGKFIGLLADSSPKVKREAATGLALHGPPPLIAIAPLLQCLADPDCAVRAMAAKALGTLTVWEPGVFTGVFARISDPSSEVVDEAIAAIRGFGERFSGAKVGLDRRLEGREPEDRLRAAMVLVLMEDPPPLSLEVLLGAVLGEDTRFRELAIHGLSGLRGRSLTPAFSDLLRGRAAEAVPVLASVLGTAPSSPRWNQALHALSAFGPDAAPALQAIAGALASKDRRVLALEVLRGMGPAGAGAAPEVVKVLLDRESAERVLAADVLIAFGENGGAVAMAGLEKAKDDPDLRVWAASLEAIATLRVPPDQEGRSAAKVVREMVGKYSTDGLLVTLASEEKIEEFRKKSSEDVASLAGRGGAAVPLLLRMVEGEPCSCRLLAVLALGEIGPTAQSAVPALWRLRALRGDDPFRDLLTQTLRRIDPDGTERGLKAPWPPFSRGPTALYARRFQAHSDKDLTKEGGTGTQAAVALALEWLAHHQSLDGNWDCDGFESLCKQNKCGGAGGPLYDPGVTGLALLAFLGHGESPGTERYGPVVRRGLSHLMSTQDSEGCFGTRYTHKFMYCHAVATLAMCEAYGMTGNPDLGKGAQQAIKFIESAQNPYLGWRYGVRPQDNDTSVSCWMVYALHAGKGAGLDVSPACFDGARAWLDKVTEPEYGRAGYTARGNGPSRPQELMDKFPQDKSESLTAMSMVARMFSGASRKDEMLKKGLDLCMKSLPVWDEASGCIDFIHWHFGTVAMFQVGGEPWKKWNLSMRKAITDGQRHDRNDDRWGSWDPVDPWGSDGGRIGSTALNCLTLETYYRYPSGLPAK